MNILESSIYTLRDLAQTSNTKALVEVLNKLLLEQNSNNWEALLEYGNLEQEYLDLEKVPNYQVLTGGYIDTTGNYLTQEELDELIEYQELKLEAWEAKQTLVESLEIELERKELILERIQNKLDQLTERLEELQSLDFEPDDIMVDTLYRFGNRDADKDMAELVGLGILEDEDTSNTWLFFTSWGMDLRPKLAAYCALKFGFVLEEHRRYFKQVSYFRDVIGSKAFKQVCQRLHLEQAFAEYLI